ncbi:MAG: hypothetical protein KGV59_04520 [Tenacibaculum sp.]|nr:hypothetical protein [Tenacibaculum sp.]
MKKDIKIPEVKDIEIAIVKEENEEWSVYILNKKEVDIEMVVIVSQGFSETKTTSLFRRKIDRLPAKSFARFELIQPELFALDNRFQVTFFENNTLYDKTYTFKKDTVKDGSLRMIKMLGKRGVVVK